MNGLLSRIRVALLLAAASSACIANPAQPQKQEGIKENASPFVQIISTRSDAMGKEIPAAVVLPESYFKEGDKTRYPVVYLLHGYGGSYRTWLHRGVDIKKLSSRYGIILVCPDARNSWYWDSPKIPESKYETYIVKELVRQIDQKYRTINSPKGRAITGFSMGGQGGLWLGFRHQDVFGACGAISGCADIRRFPKSFEISKLLGDKDSNVENWESHSIMNQINLLKPHKPAIIIDCGTEDFLYKVNEALHAKLLENNIPHDYITRPGEHNSPYLGNSLLYQIQFFDTFFHDPDFLWIRRGAPSPAKP